MGAPLALSFGLRIEHKGGLAVRLGRQQTEATIVLPDRAEEPADGFATQVPVRPRRHRVGRLALQEGDEAVEVLVLPGSNVSVEQRLLVRRDDDTLVNAGGTIVALQRRP